MEHHFQQSNFNNLKPKNRKKKTFLIVGLIIFLYIIFNLGKTTHVVTTQNQPWWQRFGLFLNSSLPLSPSREEKESLEKNFPLPGEEENRWDVLILGIRGVEDPDGGLLSDSILLFSLNKETGKSSLTSIPRDTYAEMPGLAKGKINEIYEKGIAHRKAVDFSKEAFSRLTGVYVDNVVVFDFKAFQEIVDALGGIELNLKKPFAEKNQWGYEFSLPAGTNHLNGQDALYFVRSRYGTSDFDRSLRQQQIILAIKDQALSAGVLGNPLKLGAILKSVNKNIVTDLNIFDTGNLLKLANSLDIKENTPALNHLSTDNILYQTLRNDIYILRPQNNDWVLFRKYFKDILN